MTRRAPPAPGLRARTARAGEGRPRRAPLAMAAGAGLALWLALPAAGQEAPLAVPALSLPPLPSGQAVELVDAALEMQGDGELWLILRYLAPRIARGAGDLGYDDVAADLDALCDGPGLAAAAAAQAAEGRAPDQIVVALMDRPVERGVPDPDATQFIGAYAPGAEGCAWR